jgi:hypothetical protein
VSGTRKRVLVAGLALIALVNVAVLAGVAYNRSGEPESRLTLTERELRPSGMVGPHENSGLAMHLQWRVPVDEVHEGYYHGYGEVAYGGAPPWLDEAKMAELGFDVSIPDVDIESRHSFKREQPRDVLLVLELDGPAYQQSIAGALKYAETLKAKNNPESSKLADEIVPKERKFNSRLFVVDAGLDATSLRTKYPDRSKYAVVPGRVAPAMRFSATGGRHAGYVQAVSIATINVPLALHGAFEGAVPDVGFPIFTPSGKRARYEARLAFGKRLEPWLMEAARK